MLLKYRDPQFWKKFHDRHWRPRVPTVLRRPFKTFPFSGDLILESLKRFEAGVRAGDHRKACLLSIGDVETAPRRPLRTLFKEETHSIEELDQACRRVFRKKTFGLMVTQTQAVHPGIWEGLTSVLHDAAEYLEVPPPSTYVDFFYGNYSSAFTGIHKDTQEIIAFVIHGKKRILAWPFDYFLSRVEGLGHGDRYFNRRLDVDPRKYRKDAIVLDAQAGDVIYWPSDYWHVAEGKPGTFSAMLSLGITRPDGPREASPFTRALTRPGPCSRQIAGAESQLRWATGYGFELGGPIAEKSVPGIFRVIRKKNSVILWTKDESRGRLLVSTNGHALSLPFSPALVKLLAALARDEAVAPKGRGQRHTIFETSFDKRCELKTRKSTSAGNPGASLVDWLLRVFAVDEFRT